MQGAPFRVLWMAGVLMKRTLLVGMVTTIVAAVTACGGAGKPPLQPDSDSTSSLGDGGPEPSAAPAQPAAPAPAR